MVTRVKALMETAAIESFHNLRVDPHTFTIYVGGDPQADKPKEDDNAAEEPGVEYRMADRFEQNVHILSHIDEDKPILVQMASIGGNWDDGLQMLGAILTCPNPVTVLGTKWCRSMSSIIPLAADRFVMRPPTRYMIHRGKDGFDGLDQEADTHDIERRKGDEIMTRIYVNRLREQGKFKDAPESQVRTFLRRGMEQQIDMWYTTDEAYRMGFTDGLYTGNRLRLRTEKVNHKRRKSLMEVLRKPVKVEVIVS